MEPYRYISSLPSKGFRDMAAEAFNVWLQVPREKLDQICDVISTLHTASLL